MPVEGMAEAVLLLLLAERPQHGYELAIRIGEEELVAGRVRAGRVYETLSRLAAQGFVEAQQEQSPTGPDRWRYRLTPAGEERLARWRSGLERSWRRISYFIHRYDRQFGLTHEHRDHARGRTALHPNPDAGEAAEPGGVASVHVRL